MKMMSIEREAGKNEFGMSRSQGQNGQNGQIKIHINLTRTSPSPSPGVRDGEQHPA